VLVRLAIWGRCEARVRALGVLLWRAVEALFVLVADFGRLADFLRSGVERPSPAAFF